MKSHWLNSVLPIAAIFSFRMLGLFMLIPVFTLYASELQGATPALTGIALGIYGLSQGILQIPFGMLSDRYGRKPLILIGLFLLTLGSLLGAFTHSIYGMIIARALQGGGAIGSVLIALLADLTPDNERTKAMAVIGVTIGLSFSLAMIISPGIAHYSGLSGIFYFSITMAIAGVLLIYFVIPTPATLPATNKNALLTVVLLNLQLQRLNLGIFFQHFILTSTFFILPLLLKEQMHQGYLAEQWLFYLPVLLGSFITMMPLILLAEKKRWMKPLFLITVMVAALSQYLLGSLYHSWYALCIVLFFYFVAFNYLEASLPSLISRQASPAARGTAMGVYSSSQFLGIFLGGTVAGIVFQWIGTPGIFIANTITALLWLFIAVFMKN